MSDLSNPLGGKNSVPIQLSWTRLFSHKEILTVRTRSCFGLKHHRRGWSPWKTSSSCVALYSTWTVDIHVHLSHDMCKVWRCQCNGQIWMHVWFVIVKGIFQCKCIPWSNTQLASSLQTSSLERESNTVSRCVRPWSKLTPEYPFNWRHFIHHPSIALCGCSFFLSAQRYSARETKEKMCALTAQCHSENNCSSKSSPLNKDRLHICRRRGTDVKYLKRLVPPDTDIISSRACLLSSVRYNSESQSSIPNWRAVGYPLFSCTPCHS